MTIEQYNRSTIIIDKIKKLEIIKETLEFNKYKLSYVYHSNDCGLCQLNFSDIISDIYKKHDSMIRKDIDDKIKSLEKELSEI